MMTAKWTVHPSSEEAAFLLEAAIIYREARNFDAARDILTGVTALFPKHDVPEVILGTVEFQAGNLDAAETHYLKALELNPRSAFAYAHLGEVCLFRKEKEDARKHLKNSVALDPLGEYGKMARKLMELTDKVNFA